MNAETKEEEKGNNYTVFYKFIEIVIYTKSCSSAVITILSSVMFFQEYFISENKYLFLGTI